MKDILNKLETLSISELDKVVEEAKNWRWEKFHAKYKVVEVHDYNGNISRKIKDETNFSTQYSQEIENTIGTNHIIIPIEKYSKELEEELILKYNCVN